MNHSFDVDEAVLHGVEKAVILSNLRFWIAKNLANKKHVYDGFCWTYNSTSAFSELFPYMSPQKIGRLLREMEGDGIIKSGNYNKAGYDRTKWYTVPSMFIIQNQTMDNSDLNNGLLRIEQPIPDSKPDSKPDNWDYDKCKAIWNEVKSEHECPSTGCNIVPDSLKSGLLRVHKAYVKYCKDNNKTELEKHDWFRAYAKGHLRRCSTFVGKNESYSWKPSIKDLGQMKTFEALINQ